MSQFLVFNVGAAVFIVGVLIRDVILSRAVFALGGAVFVYGFALSNDNFFALNNFIALNWAVAFLLVNMAVIWASLRDRFTTPLSPEEQALAKEMPQFSDGDFRRLMQSCTWQTLDASLQLTEQGKPSKTLYYIVAGGATVTKSGKELEVGDNLLIGEISFSQDVPATATVHAHEGSVLISWPSKKLKRLLKRKSLKAAFDALLSHDLADKLANDESRGRRYLNAGRLEQAAHRLNGGADKTAHHIHKAALVGSIGAVRLGLTRHRFGHQLRGDARRLLGLPLRPLIARLAGRLGLITGNIAAFRKGIGLADNERGRQWQDQQRDSEGEKRFTHDKTPNSSSNFASIRATVQ